MSVSFVLKFIKRNLNKIEAALVLVAIVGASVTLILGGSVKPDTIRIIDASALASPPYGESNSGPIVGYSDNYSTWIPSSNAQISSSQNSLVVTGAFANVSTWTSTTIVKAVTINITSYPLLNVDLSLTTGVRYGIRFFARYPNGTAYNVWWEGSPLDHRDGIGNESLRVNMQRQALLATGHVVNTLTKIEIYVENPPNSPQSFRFVLSRLSLENDVLEQAAAGEFRAIYFDLKSIPQGNESWSLNKVNLGVTIQANQGTVFSIYLFEGTSIYGSTTAAGLSYDPLASFSEYTFYPNTPQQIFPELLPRSNTSIVLVVSGGALRYANVDYVDFVFLPMIATPTVSQQSTALLYTYFVFFLFLLPVGLAILVFKEFLSRSFVPKATIVIVLVTGILCRLALATTTAHIFDMNVYLSSIRGWFQYRTPSGSLGPTLPFTFFLFWIGYSPYALLQLVGFHDAQFLGHAAGIIESVFVKLFPILMDALTFYLLLRFRNTGVGFVWATFYFLNPLAIFVSSVWGQYEAATMAFVVWGVYCVSRQRYGRAALAFVGSGMIELAGFLPYVLLLLRTTRMKLYKTLFVGALAIIPVVVYPPETDLILRISLSLIGFARGQFSQPGPYSLLGNFREFSIVSQFKPLLLSQGAVLVAACFDIYGQKMNAERMVFYVGLSSVFLLLFSNLLASWAWLLPICLLYTTIKGKNDLGAFMLVFGTSVTFLLVSNTTGSAYLILGNVGVSILPAVEGIRNQLKIFTVMLTTLAVTLLFYLIYGGARPSQTILRTSAMTLSLYLLLYFWLAVYPI